ncbi:MAG: TonB-dependent receptor [Sphingomonadales bacterium]|nr:TonB-dependent receptor [Sphingomonadales bacterium]
MIALFCLGDSIAQRKECPYFLHLRILTELPQASVKDGDSATGIFHKPADGAEIFVELSHSIAHADANGFATLKGLCSTTTDVEINHQGKHHHLILLSKSAEESANRSLFVVVLNGDRDSTFVVSKTEYLSSQQFLSETLPLAQVRARVNTQGDALLSAQLQAMPLQNLARSLEPLPMAQTLSTGMGIGKPVVQGMFGQRLPILNNGFRIEGQTWGLDHAPEVDLWGAQTVQLLRGTEALAVAADAWGNAINLVNHYDFHQFNRDYTQLLSTQTNGGGIQVAGRYIQGREKQHPGQWTENSLRMLQHPYGKGHYWLYSGKMTGNYSTPTHTLSNTATREASVSYGNLWNSQRGYWGLKAKAEREFHAKAYFFRGGIFSESHIGNVNDLLLAMQRTEPLQNAPFSYHINKPMQQAGHFQASYNNRNEVLGKYLIHHKFAVQINQRWEFDPHRSSTKTFAQLNLWQGTINQYTGFSRIRPTRTWQSKWVFQNSGQWQRYSGYYFLPDFQQWQPNIHWHISNTRNLKAQHSLVLRGDYLIRNVFPKSNGKTTETWQRNFGPSAAYSLIREMGHHQWQLHVSQLWRTPSVNELYTRGVHHGAASYEEGNASLKPETGQKIELLWLATGKTHEIRATTFYQQSQNFIALFPMATPVLTVRGAFPGYEYKQLPTQYAGAEIQYSQKWANRGLQIALRAGGIYARVKQGEDMRHPNFLPCPRGSIQINKRWSHATLMLEAIGVGKQPLYTPGTDFLPPPNGYVLVNAQLQLNTKGHDQHAHWVIYGENLGNKAYRDYMDRFRYFTNQSGMNVGIKWLYDVHHHHEHKHDGIMHDEHRPPDDSFKYIK